MYDRVYVGKNLRREITYILGRIGYDELTANAKMELPNVIERIIKDREEWFINFFNESQAITPQDARPRAHTKYREEVYVADNRYEGEEALQELRGPPEEGEHTKPSQADNEEDTERAHGEGQA